MSVNMEIEQSNIPADENLVLLQSHAETVLQKRQKFIDGELD